MQPILVKAIAAAAIILLGLAGLTLNLSITTMFLFCLGLGILLTTSRHGIARPGYRPTMSSDTMSSLYPDRPIRPLPKRRLKERLSPEAVDSIKYPPTPEATQPLFYYPYEHRDNNSSSSNRAAIRTPERARVFRRNGMSTAPDSDEDEGPRTVAIPWPSPQVGPRLGRKEALGHHSASNIAPSTSSSADGYDSFENTNNKKKRKIPSPVDHVLTGGHTLVEISNLTISHPSGNEGADCASPPSGHYNGAGSNFMSSIQGMSGPGRGRFGRSRNGRSPLRTLSDSSTNWAGRSGKIRPLQLTQRQDVPTAEGSGIISSAIANAEKLPTSRGQENISLLQQTGNLKSSSASSLFTFTCESQVSSVAWPASDTASSSIQSPSSKSSTAHNMQSTHTSPPRADSSFGNKDPSHPSNNGTETAPPRRKHKSKAARRQKLDRELHRQADERRRETQIRNRGGHHDDDGYICLYCEYQILFGETPWALVRQYELKDRQRRKAEAERKRLIEKAKTRSRKNRKAAGKTGAKGSNNTDQNQNTNGTNPDHQGPDDHPGDDTEEPYDGGVDDAEGQSGEEATDDGCEEGAASDHCHGEEEGYGHEHNHIHEHGNGVAGGGTGGRGRVGGIHTQSLQPCTCGHV